MNSGFESNSNVYVKDYKLPDDGTDNLKKMITVVPSPFWIMVIGGVLIVSMLIGWLFAAEIIKTITTVGIYHPGAADEGEVLCFVPVTTGKGLEVGMKASLCPFGFDQQETGHLVGEIGYVAPYVTAVDTMYSLLEDNTVVSSFTGKGPVMLVTIKLNENPDTVSGYFWSNDRGGTIKVNDGTYMTVVIETETNKPIDYMLPDFLK